MHNPINIIHVALDSLLAIYLLITLNYTSGGVFIHQLVAEGLVMVILYQIDTTRYNVYVANEENHLLHL